jgi:riboflavin kinase/FMN adenylyltransferase
MLGRNYSLSGIVIHGENLASSKLKCPTANISVPNGIVPPDGVYAGIAHIDNDTFPAAISVGVSPTFSEKQRTSEDIEVHLLGFQGDLYSKMLEVEFIEYIREERCFPDSLTLGKQIQNDLIKITEVFEHIKGQNLLK